MDLAEGEYIVVLHSYLLIYDEGWLDHIVEFMDLREDVGLVGLAGRHAINADGLPEFSTTVVNMRGYPDKYIPTWRFTEVATIDGLGWVMRNKGLRLEESFGLMHFYDLDISMQYLEAGDKVYVAAVDIWHMAEDAGKSSRSALGYLKAIGMDDDSFYDEVREKFRLKWQHLLPVWRGFRDEAYGFYLAGEQKRLTRYMEEEVTPYCRRLEAEWQEKCEQVQSAQARIETLEKELEAAVSRETRGKGEEARWASEAYRSLRFGIGRKQSRKGDEKK